MYVCSSVEGKIVVCSMVCVYVYQSLLLSKNKGKLYFFRGKYIFLFSYILCYFFTFYIFLSFFSTTTNDDGKISLPRKNLRARTAAAAEQGWYCVLWKGWKLGMRIKTIKQCVYTVEQNGSKDSFFSYFPLFFRGGSRVGGVRKYSCCCCCFALCLNLSVYG